MINDALILECYTFSFVFSYIKYNIPQQQGSVKSTIVLSSVYYSKSIMHAAGCTCVSHNRS